MEDYTIENIYDFEYEDVEKYTFADRIRVCIYENLEIDFSEIKEL